MRRGRMRLARLVTSRALARLDASGSLLTDRQLTPSGGERPGSVPGASGCVNRGHKSLPVQVPSETEMRVDPCSRPRSSLRSLGNGGTARTQTRHC